MLEGTPAMPFGGYTKSLLQVEPQVAEMSDIGPRRIG